MKPFFDVEGKRGMRCCKDCLNFDPRGLPYTEFKGKAGAKGSADISIPGLGGSKKFRPKTIAPGLSVTGEYFASVAGLTVSVSAAGGVNYLTIPGCEDEDCGSFSMGADVSGNFGPTLKGKVEVVACSADDDQCQKNPPTIIGAEFEALSGVAASGFVGVEGASGAQCGNDCVGARINEVKLQASVSAQVEFLFKRIKYENSVETVLYEGGSFGTPGCG